MKWKYYRIKESRASKWVSGNHWVTKHDGAIACVIGIKGERRNDLFGTPREARKYIESVAKNA